MSLFVVQSTRQTSPTTTTVSEGTSGGARRSTDGSEERMMARADVPHLYPSESRGKGTGERESASCCCLSPVACPKARFTTPYHTLRLPKKRERGGVQEGESRKGRTAVCLPSGPWRRKGTRQWFCVSQKPYPPSKRDAKGLTEVDNDGLLAVDLERRVREMSGRVREWPALIGGGRGGACRDAGRVREKVD
jgi:hypothetical protein